MYEPLGYPLRGDHAEKALLAAWLCALVHAIALPVLALVPLLGYVASVLAAGDEPEPPPFLRRETLERSVGASALVAAYGAVPLGVALVTFRLLAATEREPTGGGVFVVLLGATAVLFVLATFAYLLPIGLANYARSGSLRAGVSGLAGVAGHAAYFVGWCAGAVLLLVGAALSSGLADAGGVLAVLGSLVGAYAALVGARRIGLGYAAANRYR